MHIKRFEAGNMREALAQIREELGPDALILESGRIDDGSGRVVVRAAMPRTEPASNEAPSRIAQMMGARAEREAVVAEEPRRAGSIASTNWNASTNASGNTNGAAQSLPRTDSPETRLRAEYLSRLVRSDHFSAIPLPLREVYLRLVDAEVDSNLVFQILQRMGNAPLPGQFHAAPYDELLAYLRGLIAIGGSVTAGTRRRVIALVGPTGVGKTTTAAKIAGHAAFRLGLKVALVSSDSYRIFGAEHLASYAGLMGIPFETVGSAAEMRGVLLGPLANANLVLIDTTGRSPRDPGGIAETHDLLGAWPELEVNLVLSANGAVRDLSLALESFSRLPIRHLSFTKLDEATTRGGILSLALKARRPVAYLGTGQEVPDDLEPATSEALTDGLLLAEEEAA